MAGAVGGGAGALHGGAFTELGGVATKRTLVDLAFFGAREGHAVVLQLIHRLGRFAGQVFHRIRVAQPVRALHGVIHVPLPVVRAHVRQRGGDAALGGHGVGAGREDLGHAGGAQTLFGHAQRGAQAGATGAHHHDVIFMRLVLVFGHWSASYAVNAIFRMEKVPARAKSEQVRRAVMISTISARPCT